jgi:hypothetical protein
LAVQSGGRARAGEADHGEALLRVS